MSISSACLIYLLLLEEYVMVIRSINCYLESNELINIIIEGKLNKGQNYIGLGLGLGYR